MDPDLIRVRDALFEKLNYKPWPTQKEFHDSDARWKGLFAGSRFGKSMCAARDVLVDILKPNTRGWIVGNSYDQPSKEFRYIYSDLVITLGFKPSKEHNAKYSVPGPQSLIFPWGSEVYTKSQDVPESLLGEEIDWLILSEASRLNEKIYDMYLRARLGSRKGRVLIPTTPHGYNWVYKRFYIPAVEDGKQYWAKIVSVLENLEFPRDEYERAKNELPEEIFEEQYNGKFVAYTGLVYKRFSRQEHIIDPFEIPKHWVKYMAIDPHPQTPCAGLWLAVDEHGACYLYDEMFIPDLTIPEIADKINFKENGAVIRKRLIDPNAKMIDKLRGQTVSVQMQFVREGIFCQPANNKFESAFYAISECLTPKEVYGGNIKKPRLFVFKTLKKTIEEFETHTWEEEEKGKGGHILDALKYIFNDRPVRTWTEEEREQTKKDEYKRLKERNVITGY